jgi:hypothetical protein
MGEEQLAIDHYQRSLELEPDNAEAAEFLVSRAGSGGQ